MNQKKVMVIGSTGLIGTQLIERLSNDPAISEIICPVRKSIPSPPPKVTYYPIDFKQLDSHTPLFQGVSAILCCIGTTIKKAKTKEKFEWVDHDIPLHVAKIAKAEGIESYSIVTSIGARKSGGSYYLRVKGRIEAALYDIGFQRLIIYRPSFLLGKRKEFRLGEAIMIPLFNLFHWIIPKKYRATDSATLATLMHHHLDTLESDHHIIEADAIK